MLETFLAEQLTMDGEYTRVVVVILNHFDGSCYYGVALHAGTFETVRINVLDLALIETGAPVRMPDGFRLFRAPQVTAPVYAHDCNTCQFLGHLYDYDWWLHRYASYDSLCVRYGSEGSEYLSMSPKAVLDNPQGIASVYGTSLLVQPAESGKPLVSSLEQVWAARILIAHNLHREPPC